MRLPDEMLMATLNTPTPCDKSGVTMAGFLFNSAGFVPPPAWGGLPQISLKSVALKHIHAHTHTAHGNTHDLYKERQRGRERERKCMEGRPRAIGSALPPLSRLRPYFGPWLRCHYTNCPHSPTASRWVRAHTTHEATVIALETKRTPRHTHFGKTTRSSFDSLKPAKDWKCARWAEKQAGNTRKETKLTFDHWLQACKEQTATRPENEESITQKEGRKKMDEVRLDSKKEQSCMQAAGKSSLLSTENTNTEEPILRVAAETTKCHLIKKQKLPNNQVRLLAATTVTRSK